MAHLSTSLSFDTVEGGPPVRMSFKGGTAPFRFLDKKLQCSAEADLLLGHGVFLFMKYSYYRVNPGLTNLLVLVGSPGSQVLSKGRASSKNQHIRPMNHYPVGGLKHVFPFSWEFRHPDFS